jgi:hypothetical protein
VPPAHYTLGPEMVQLNMRDRTITLFNIGVGYSSLNLDGSLRCGPIQPSIYSNGTGTILLAEERGWTVSHVKRANDACFLPWTSSEPRIELGLRRLAWLQAAAMPPSGNYLAFSSTEERNAAISVVRLQDKTAIFRHYVPGYWVC